MIYYDIIVLDRQTGLMTSASVSSTGEQGLAGAFIPSISADGRYVGFRSESNNLVDGDTNGSDVFIHDRMTGITERVSLSINDEQGNDDSFGLSFSSDVQYAVFTSRASNLVENDQTSIGADIFAINNPLTSTGTELITVEKPINNAIRESRDEAAQTFGRHTIPTTL